MTTIPPERVTELGVFLLTLNSEGWSPKRASWGNDLSDLLLILDDYAALKAENEGWAEVLEDAANKHLRNLDRIAKLEAELAKQAPLIQAVVGATLYDSEAPGVTMLEFGEQAERAILRAALALRGTK